MIIVFETIICMVLIALGVIATYNYLHKIEWYKFNRASLRLTRNKIIFIICGLVSAALLITLFQIVYKQPVLKQIKLLVLVFMILPCAATDYKVHKIPNRFILTALAARAVIYVIELLRSPYTTLSNIVNEIITVVIICGFFLLLLLIFKDSIGMGDIKLFAVMGLYQGLWGTVNSVFFSLAVSFVASVFLLITKKKGRKDVIAFGPSIFLGTVIAISVSGM